MLPGETSNSMDSETGIMPLCQHVVVWPRVKCSPPKHEALNCISLGFRHLIVFPDTELCSCANTDGMVMTEKLETQKTSSTCRLYCIKFGLVLYCVGFGICYLHWF